MAVAAAGPIEIDAAITLPIAAAGPISMAASIAMAIANPFRHGSCADVRRGPNDIWTGENLGG